MTVTLYGKEIKLDKTEVALARKTVNEFLEGVNKIAEEKKRSSMFFTTVIMMQAMSQSVLEEMDIENLEFLMNYNKQ